MPAHQADARHVAGAEQHERGLDAGVAVQRHRPGRGQATAASTIIRAHEPSMNASGSPNVRHA